MAKTGWLRVPIGPNVEFVWLFNVPLCWNNERQFAPIPVPNVILPTYIIDYEQRNANCTIATHTLHDIVQCTPVGLSVYLVEDSRTLEFNGMVCDIIIACCIPFDLLGAIP